MSSLSLLALLAGIALATQAGMNARLGMLLDNSLLAACIAFVCSCLCLFVLAITLTEHYPKLATIRAIPFYLWFSGGVLSALSVTLIYYLIPKMGVSPVLTYTISGQLLMATVGGHYGWFDLPEKPISAVQFTGFFALMAGIILSNWE